MSHGVPGYGVGNQDVSAGGQYELEYTIARYRSCSKIKPTCRSERFANPTTQHSRVKP